MRRIPDISFIVPIYNVEDYLTECLDSLVNQENVNSEVILIDDGSTDGSLIIAQRYEQRYKNVKLFSYVNGGVSVARNRGIEKANGKYLQFIDSDDFIPQNTLQYTITLMDNERLDICLGSSSIKNESADLALQHHDWNYRRPPRINKKCLDGKEMFKLLNRYTYNTQACMYITKTDIIKSINFLPGIYHEDNLFTTQLLLSHSSRRVMSIVDDIYVRRIRLNSIMTSEISFRHADGYYAVFQNLITLFYLRKDINGHCKQALAKFILVMLRNSSDAYAHCLRSKNLMSRFKMRLKIIKGYLGFRMFYVKPFLLKHLIFPSSLK